MGEIGKRLLNVSGREIEVETFEVPEPGPGKSAATLQHFMSLLPQELYSRQP